MFKVGLTGGIGSGKTTVAHLFHALGVPIIDADEIALALTQPKELAYQAICQHFGTDILNKDHTLNRKKLRELIFQTPSQKKWLESLLHPLIRNTIQEQVEQMETPYVMLVIPLLVETNAYTLDRVLCIDVPTQLQIERVQARDHCEPALIQAIIAQQAARQARLDKADDVLVNDQDIRHLRKSVEKLNKIYLELAQS